ncbi:ABC transporter substrate-binding protein [Paenibacillus graminis]|uniref:ABC transporter substrate-binding protein n=1 Tax=Paenibacillus graminis TaxID=189425 RepID=UPI002DBCD82A|nr:ABC transporter substrate-binding protein [Paenibacillus graminis]MEC0170660.1 ABC transporter substrate-binding protein [Paenibacillus graminis]
MKKLHRHSKYAAVLALVLILTSCKSVSNTKNPEVKSGDEAGIGGEITFISNRSDLVEKGAYDKYVEQFKEKYPSVEDVNVIALNDYATDIRVKILSNDYEDVMILPSDFKVKNLPEYFEPLDDLGFGDNLYFNDMNAYENKTYGITIGVASVGIIYNKKAFAAAGITAMPASLDEFYEACEKLKQADITPVHLNFSADWAVSSWGGQMSPIITGDETSLQYMSQTNEPFQQDSEIGRAYAIIRNLVQKGYAEPDLYSDSWEQSKKDVATGKTAMYYLGNWAIAQVLEQQDTGVKSEDIGFMPLPASDTGTPNAYLSPDYYFAVNKNSKNIATAKAWVKFLIEESTLADELGFMPTLKTRKSSIPQIMEFQAYNPHMLESVKLSDLHKKISSLSGVNIDDASLIQTLALAKDIDAEYAKLNEKWKQARQEILAQQMSH